MFTNSVKFSSWSALNGHQLDVEVTDIPDHISRSIDVHGFHDSGNIVYYRDDYRIHSLSILRTFVEKYMKQCIAEHNQVLERARTSWLSIH